MLFAEVGEVFGFVFGFGEACFVFDAGDYACLCHGCMLVLGDVSLTRAQDMSDDVLPTQDMQGWYNESNG